MGQVPNAHVLTVDLDSLALSLEPYWDAWADRARDVPRDFEEQKAAVQSVVDEAIDIRLRADVPVGVYLSGGMDSSLVTARLATRRDHLHAFAISYRASPAHNELAYARAVAAAHPNVELHEIPVTPEQALAALPRTAWHLERPLGNLHAAAKLIAAHTVKERVGCLLTGDGGDESFCGYASFWLQDELQRAGYRLRPIRRRLRRARAEAVRIGENLYYLERGAARHLGRRRRLLIETLGFCPTDLATALDNYRALKVPLRPEFYRRIPFSPGVALARWLAPRMPARDAHPHALRLQYIHLAALGPEYVAAVSDRTESAGSVEARHPLFDHRVVELALALPLEAKLRGDREKHVLREAYRDSLPPVVTSRRKQAFLLPPTPYASRESRALLERYLAPSAIRDAGVFRPLRVRALLAASRLRPKSRWVNLGLNVVLTTQVLHHHLLAAPASAPPEEA